MYPCLFIYLYDSNLFNDAVYKNLTRNGQTIEVKLFVNGREINRCGSDVLESWGKARTIAVRVVCVLAEIRAGNFWLHLKIVGKLPRWWNVLNSVKVLQETLDIRRKRDGRSRRKTSICSFYLTHVYAGAGIATISKLGSTKSIPKCWFLYISVTLYKHVFFSGRNTMTRISLCL